MRILKALIFVVSFSAFAGSVFAGEDSTHRMHCTGTTFYDNPAGMQTFDQSQAECGATLQAG
jgi:hypothetical protein